MIGPASPLFFGPHERPLFGWYHPACGAPAEVREGLLLCPPLGQEDINAHRSVRYLADAAAQQGVPVLRFDYDGCGDSAGDDMDPDRVDAWLASVHAAIDELKRLAGITRVTVLGIRAGALLAAVACARRDDVGSLIAIAPVVSGRAFVREWTTLGLVREWKAPSAAEASANGNGDAPIEAAGYVMSKSTRDALQQLDLMKLPSVAPEVLVIERDGMVRRDRWAAHLAASGARVAQEVLPGYLGMMSEPHNVQVPQAMVDRVLAWMAPRAALRRPDAPAAVPLQTASVAAAAQETLLAIDGGAPQFGILTEPLARQRPRRALLLLNSGACRRIGPNRVYVPLARQLAQRGWTVLRVDISGLGDSEPHAGQPENAPYTSRARQDIAMWLGQLHERGLEEVHLLGICSGAYHGFKAAIAGLPFASVIPVNSVVFFWRDGMPLDPPMAEHRVLKMAEVYKKAVFDRRKWVRLLTGRTDFVRPLHVVLRRLSARVRDGVRWCRRLAGVPLSDDLVVELRHLRERGARLHFVFAEGEVGQRILREQGGSAFRALVSAGQVTTCELQGTDHTFSTAAARRALLAELDRYLNTTLPASQAQGVSPGVRVASA